MRVLHVASECYPWVKTGGLADVMGALPQAQQQLGADVRLLLPAFAPLRAALRDAVGINAPLMTPAGEVRIFQGYLNDLKVYLLEAPHLFDRAGSPYADSRQQPFSDNHLRFAALSYVAAKLASGLDYFWRPDVVHAHDWHTGLVPAYLVAQGASARSVFTIHNLAYPGRFNRGIFADLWLPSHFNDFQGVEFYGDVSLIKAGIFYADQVTTVSPSYAQEITQAGAGEGLEGLLSTRRDQGRLQGILNGVDLSVWNPATDGYLPHTYSARQFAGKARCKQALQVQLGLTEDKKAPLFIVISRLVEQKGLHLLLGCLPYFLETSAAQWVILGSGEAWQEHAFGDLASQHPDKMKTIIGYDEHLSHQLMGAGNVVVIPSYFEPCGLTQLYGLKYGLLPLVRAVGGLADTVSDFSQLDQDKPTGYGFTFDAFAEQALHDSILRALALWEEPLLWKKIAQRNMGQDFSWQVAAHNYLSLYQHTQ